MSPRLVLVRILVLLADLLIRFVETHDFLSDRRSTTIGGLVTEVENLRTCRASTIVHHALGHDSDHCTLARVNVANYCNTHIVEVSLLRRLLELVLQELGVFNRVSNLLCHRLVNHMTTSWRNLATFHAFVLLLFFFRDFLSGCISLIVLRRSLRLSFPSVSTIGRAFGCWLVSFGLFNNRGRFG